MTILSIYVLVMDVKLQKEHPLSFFLGALYLREILLPVLALFHPLVGFLFHTPDTILRWVFRWATILASLLTVGSLIRVAVIPGYLTTFRFETLPSLPAEWSSDPQNAKNLAVCTNRYEGLSVIEMIGLALGGYDVHRSASVFSRQMDFFSGLNSTERIDYEVVELGPDVPLLIYNVSGATIFPFRGFASPSELAVQIERFASLWVVPFFLEELPPYGTIRDRYLSSSTA
jgi:hypothetical protein